MSVFNNIHDNILVALGQKKADLVVKNANVLNVFTEKFEKTDIAISNGFIVGLGSYQGLIEIDAENKFVVPSFIDGHIHIESSLMSPKQFCNAVIPHGTTVVVADPHEITNVLGKKGFEYILNSSKNLPLDVYLTVPSCVPATPFDESGAVITSDDVAQMISNPRVVGLAEMMNYPAVLGCDSDVLEKLKVAYNSNKIIDGHAPMLTRNNLNAYVAAGASSDHECTTFNEAIEKIRLGQWIMIREGTASKNLEDLLPLFDKPYCDRCMLVTDDKHAGELAKEGHIDYIVKKAISLGVNPINAYKMASFNTARYFDLKQNGAIAPGYSADFIILDDINSVKINSVFKAGKRVDDCVCKLTYNIGDTSFNADIRETVRLANISADSFKLSKEKEKVIGLVAGQIITTDEGYSSEINIEKDICKLAVLERHNNTGHIGVAFVKGYGLKKGAVATSVAHDSHNVIVVGTNEDDMAFAVSKIREMQGGMIVVEENKTVADFALPIAGLMCGLDAIQCDNKLVCVKNAAYSLGVNKDIDPFMTLSFASLAVIPKLRLTTLGVVDVEKFKLLDE